MAKRIVIYKCEGCNKDFEVPQGSRRRYCPDCAMTRIIAGAQKKPQKAS